MIINGLGTDVNVDFELGEIQSHKNMAIVPIITPQSHNTDFLTLKKGLELDLVEVVECEKSTVNIIQIKNKSVSPLILIEGEEILGSMQNRIINTTTVISPKTTAHVNVNCTERGRWHPVSSKFRQSEYMANSRTRHSRMSASFKKMSPQSHVWESIENLEADNSFRSKTNAMSESYDNLKADHDEFLKSFHIDENQSGVVVIFNGEIKGFELFYNHEIYEEYHQKVLKSYLIDNKNENELFTVDADAVENMINNAAGSTFTLKETASEEEAFEFKNNDGIGTLYLLNGELIHWSYINNTEDIPFEDEASTPLMERIL